MIGYPATDAERRFREIAALLEQARDSLTAFAAERERTDFEDALSQIDAAILKCESAME